MRLFLFIFFISKLFYATAESNFMWFHHVTLDSDNRFHVQWSFDMPSETIIFNICVQTSGWFGFGFSPNGGMTGSDLAIAWVDSYGRAHLQVF